MPQRHIFAIGDNDFRKNPDLRPLNEYILSFAGKPSPRVCVIPTASGDDEKYVQDFFSVFKKYNCQVTQLSLFRGETEQIEELILSQDLIYVTGGNTRNLLTLWKDWKVDQYIRKAYEQGVILAGGSAGSLCWFAEGNTDSIPGRLSSLKCLGFLKESNCPHYDEPGRRSSYLASIEAEELCAGYAAENGVALHFVNEAFHEAVSAHDGKFGYFIEKKDGAACETRLSARTLGEART